MCKEANRKTLVVYLVKNDENLPSVVPLKTPFNPIKAPQNRHFYPRKV